jgi:hypothetical protein
VTSPEWNSINATGQTQSTGAFSLSGEGTSFAREAATALSYVQVGRDNPGRTGQPVYVIEYRRSSAMQGRAGYDYLASQAPISNDHILRAWSFNPDTTVRNAPRPSTRKAFAPPAWLIIKAYPALVRLANQLEPHLREAFLEAINNMRGAVNLERLAAAIQSNSLNAVQIEVQLAKFAERFGELAPVLKSGFHVGANVGLRQLAEEASISLRFDVVNPAAVEHAQNHLAQIVRPFIDDAKEIIAEIVGDAVNGKYTYASAAREIRDTIGLDPRRYEALQNYEASLVELGVSGEALDGKLARYERTLLKSRSETIARTEIMRAATAGQREAWEEAARQGLLRRDEWNRVWKTTDDERLCNECGPMDEEWVAFNDEFQGGDPPLHPNCRCTIKLEQA